MVNPAYLLLVYFLISLPSKLKEYHAEDIANDQIEAAKKFAHQNQDAPETYDYIVVGGGTAGAVLANRLSEDISNSVLVLERGGNPTPISSVPYHWLYLARIDTPGSVTRYKTVPQPGYSLATNGVITILQGNVLGGTSTLNQMVYTRGNSKIYDQWANLMGDPDWSYKSLLPLFNKFEDYHGTFENPPNDPVYGTGGELYIESANLVQPSASIFFSAALENNIPIKDLNARQSKGFQPIDFNSKRGRRFGTYQAFLEPILGRSNLHVSRYSTAVKIHFDETLRATGVTYIRHGQTHFVQARKEVIVCAGIFESARLLMLSGIGPRNDLISLGIEVLSELPVGQNLRDHLGVTIQMIINKNVTFVPERDLTAEMETEYDQHGTGIYRNTFGTLGYISSIANDNDDFPDIQYFIQHQADPIPDLNSVNVTRPDTNTIAVFLVRPFGQPGRVKLISTNPNDELMIDPKYGGDPYDIARLATGIKFIVDFYENSTAYKQSGGAMLDESKFPSACTSLPYRSKEYWECLVRHWGATGHHFTGTCSLNAVVDTKLRVYNTTGLRVADVSIMPTLPNGNTNAPAMMIGERAAALILLSNRDGGI